MNDRRIFDGPSFEVLDDGLGAADPGELDETDPGERDGANRGAFPTHPAASGVGLRTAGSDQLPPGAFSLLAPPGAPQIPTRVDQPTYSKDLNLDQLVAAVVSGASQPDELARIYHHTLSSVDAIRYRQETFADLQDTTLQAAALGFTERMADVRAHLARIAKMYDAREQAAWLLDAAVVYCEAVAAFAADLAGAAVHSRGLTAARDFLHAHTDSADFARLRREALACQASLAQIRYCVRVRGDHVEVSRYEGQDDYSVEIRETFRRFQQGAVRDYRVSYRNAPYLGHVGSQILRLLARLYPDEFAALDEFSQRHQSFQDEQLQRLDFELGFYLSYLRHGAGLIEAGLSFCIPQVSAGGSRVVAQDTFDLALASKLVPEGSRVVTNSFCLDGEERIIVLSGPNQGGKTTFARTFGQLHHLAALGCPVPGSSASLAVFDQIYTHFEREEQIADLRGKLEDDLVRVRELLDQVSERSIVILNEIFTSTTLDDARFLGTRIMEQLISAGVRGVYVTFIDELASLGPAVVSMMSTIVPDNPAERTFRIVRAPANGLAYAFAIAEKYDLTYERLSRRLRQ